MSFTSQDDVADIDVSHPSLLDHPHAIHHSRKIKLLVLGASGSIGTQTLDVCRRHSEAIDLVGLSVHHNVKAAVAYAHEFLPKYLVITDESQKTNPLVQDIPTATRVLFGEDALLQLVHEDDIDCCVVGIVGFAGVRVGYEALCAHKKLAYANKESLVVAGDILMPLVKKDQLIPVDSEHSAIFQCLVGEPKGALSKIWLTCSGGPFYGMSRQELARVHVQDALKHPTWNMGAKITIDSATLMNKGLEVMEASRLFDIDPSQIEVLIHRQSHIHSMVEFKDGSVKAQLGASDMRIAIQYALSYPQRWDTPTQPRVAWSSSSPMTFSAPDMKAFGCLRLALEAADQKGSAPCVLNAANEMANEAFRQEKCSFLDIEACIEHTMDQLNVCTVESLDMLEDIDAEARDVARRFLSQKHGV